MYKIDLHTHSIGSPDGSIRPEQYGHLLSANVLDYIAITDHNTIQTAVEIQETYGERIIVGEEVMTRDGEIIGLFLTERVEPNQTPLETARSIKAQGGLVYIPHPFETVRSGISKAALETITDYVDIVEVHNGRAIFQNRGPMAVAWAKLNRKARAASSDAHGTKGAGLTYTTIKEPLTRENLIEILATSQMEFSMPPLKTLLYPKLNRIRKRLGKL